VESVRFVSTVTEHHINEICNIMKNVSGVVQIFHSCFSEYGCRPVGHIYYFQTISIHFNIHCELSQKEHWA
jgi:hypothetical protein